MAACNHTLKLMSMSYTARHNQGQPGFSCDVCNKWLALHSVCFHCTTCKVWDVCLSCRNPTEEEKQSCDLKAHVVYSWVASPSGKRTCSIMGTDDKPENLQNFLDALFVRVRKPLDKSMFKITKREDFFNLLINS